MCFGVRKSELIYPIKAGVTYLEIAHGGDVAHGSYHIEDHLIRGMIPSVGDVQRGNALSPAEWSMPIRERADLPARSDVGCCRVPVERAGESEQEIPYLCDTS